MVSNVQGNIMHSNITQHKQKELQVWHLHFASSVNELSTLRLLFIKSQEMCVGIYCIILLWENLITKGVVKHHKQITNIHFWGYRKI